MGQEEWDPDQQEEVRYLEDLEKRDPNQNQISGGGRTGARVKVSWGSAGPVLLAEILSSLAQKECQGFFASDPY